MSEIKKQGDLNQFQPKILDEIGMEILMNPFHIIGVNYNGVVLGGSGSGKRILLKKLISDMLSKGVNVFLFDYGKDSNLIYDKTKKFNELSFKDNINLNLFEKAPIDDLYEVRNFLEEAKSIITMMVISSEDITDLQKKSLNEAVDKTFEIHANKTTITKIAEFLTEESIKNNDKSLKDLSELLSPFTKSGVYGKFFEGDEKFELNEGLNLFDIEEIHNSEELLPFSVQIIINLIIQMFYKEKKAPYILIIYDGWRIMEKFGSFLENLSTKIRRSGGSLFIFTERYSDLLLSKASLQFFQEAKWKIFLKNSPYHLDGLEEILDIDTIAKIKDLGISPNHSSEILINDGNKSNIYKLLFNRLRVSS